MNLTLLIAAMSHGALSRAGWRKQNVGLSFSRGAGREAKGGCFWACHRNSCGISKGLLRLYPVPSCTQRFPYIWRPGQNGG